MIYFAQIDGGPVKIGYSADVEARLGQLTAHYGRPLTLLHVMEGDEAAEREIHDRFAHLRCDRLGSRGVRPEQFRPAPELMAFIGRPLLVNPNPDATEAVSPLVRRCLTETRHARIELEEPDYERLRAVAKQNGLSIAAYIRQAVLRQVRRDEAEGEV